MEKIKRKLFIVTVDFEGKLIKDILEKEYTTVSSKGKGIEIIDEIREEKPDIILLDFAVINLDPDELIMILRGEEKTKKIPIILLYSEDNERLKYKEDYTSFVKRPVDKENLISVLNNIEQIRHETKREKKVLIVDDDSLTRKELRRVVENSAYSVLESRTGFDVLNRVSKELPDLILLDILLPDIDGFKILGKLKEDIRTKRIPVILLSAIEKAEEKAKGLYLGAADYITKPFSELELTARIQTLLDRMEEEYSASPTTRLPGNISIENAISSRITKKLPFAVCYCDLDNFKAYNDNYGFSKGDGIIRLTAKVLMSSMKELGNPDDFLGHIGGDDFILITTPDKVDPVTRRIIETFDNVIPSYYDKEARERGYIEGTDRQGRKNQFPIMSISIAVVSNTQSEIKHIGEVSDIAVGLKKRAKMTPGSIVVKDQRKSTNRASLN